MTAPRTTVDLSPYGISVNEIYRNPAPSKMYEEALTNEGGSAIASTGALVAMSGEKTGRSPGDKRIVEHPESSGDIWWGAVNIKLTDDVFNINRERAIDYLNTRNRLFVIDGYAGWDPEYRIKVRVVCERAYHALFMSNMLVRPTAEQLASFGDPDFVVFNAGRFPANKHTATMTSKTSVSLSFERREFLILGTEYAGEMKKGVFTVMNYLMPKRDILSMHCSATEGKDGDVSLFFGLSGTGKTTLSADSSRNLIGDDEHCWTDSGIFNIEGGCYAKVINISPEDEPEIFNSIQFGTVLENVRYDEISREVDYSDISVTANTRASYPVDIIPNAKIPAVAGHPSNVLFLTCDAFGVLPPVSRLNPEQAMYHFINGYTAKIPGTEVGVQEPKATFSACYGAPFMVWHPFRYAELLAEKLRKHRAATWLINTGWTGGSYGKGQRFKLKYTRAMVDAVHSGALDKVDTIEDPIFGLTIPLTCPEVPAEVLQPWQTWSNRDQYDATAAELAGLFQENFRQFADDVSDDVRAAAPRI